MTTGPIEKGAIDGQLNYGNDLLKSLKAGVSSRARAHTGASRSVGKGKKKKKASSSVNSPASTEVAIAKAENWGLLEPLRPIAGPIVDIFHPLVSANLVIGILVAVIIFMWFRSPVHPASPTVGYSSLPSSQRQIVYEEMWRREEGELWDWLDSRINLDTLALDSNLKRSGKETKALKKGAREALKDRKKVLVGKDDLARLQEEAMGQREMEDMVRVTEERLDTLKEALARRKGERIDRREHVMKGDL